MYPSSCPMPTPPVLHTLKCGGWWFHVVASTLPHSLTHSLTWILDPETCLPSCPPSPASPIPPPPIPYRMVGAWDPSPRCAPEPPGHYLPQHASPAQPPVSMPYRTPVSSCILAHPHSLLLYPCPNGLPYPPVSWRTHTASCFHALTDSHILLYPGAPTQPPPVSMP